MDDNELDVFFCLLKYVGNLLIIIFIMGKGSYCKYFVMFV